MLRDIAKRLFGKPSKDRAPLVDVEYLDVLNGRIDVFGALRSGQVAVVRNIEPIEAGRSKMMELAGPKAATELELFYRTGASPSLDTLQGLSRAIKDFRSKRLWSRLLHDFFSAMKLPNPTLYDGGIPRLVLSPEVVDAAKASGRFEGTDFQRTHSAGLTEIFMPAPANIHRDFNRPHHLFQFNMWFPLHDADADGILRVYPHLYREPIFDQNCTPEALAALGKHAEFTLAFGDAVLFHGEQLHTSPIGSSGGRRQSVDFRVAVDCHDDNGHYRQGFLNSRNFDVVPGVGSAIDLIIELEEGSEISGQRRAEILKAFDALPFAEDRYLLFASKTTDQRLIAQALRKVISFTSDYFWALKAGEIAATQAMGSLVSDASAKVRQLAQGHDRRPDYMVVHYSNAPNELGPDAALAAIDRLGRPA